MTELTLMCNYTKCKNIVTNFACVTKCFHIFCLNHAIQGEHTNRRCHTCGAILDGDFDVHQTNLSPTEDIKSTLLTGYSYKVICDIISRAINFWDYQINTKMMQYKLRVENMKLHLAEKNREVERLTLNMKHYFKKQQEKVNYLQREIEQLSSSAEDLQRQLAAKNSELLKLQSRYDELHRNTVASRITEETNRMEVEELEEVACSQKSTVPDKNHPPATPKFVFNPRSYTPMSNAKSSASCCSNSSARSRSILF